MCLFSDAELNCVKTNIRLIPELIQFEMGMSTNRYFPAIGTAGFERLAVRGYRRVPAPPPRMTAITCLLICNFFCPSSWFFILCAVVGSQGDFFLKVIQLLYY